MEQESKAFQLNLEMVRPQGKIEAYQTFEKEEQEQFIEKHRRDLS